MSKHRSVASRAYSALGRVTWKLLRRKVKTSAHRKPRSKSTATTKSRRSS
ncbi:hypothetical protein AB0P21_33470 [Kribbella sp. NPDC056861]